MQLFNLQEDVGEQNNLYEIHPEKVEELKVVPKRIIYNRRSTPGEKQSNEDMDK